MVERRLESLARAVTRAPAPLGFAVVGAVVLGILGAVLGLVLGLRSYPGTAWFAVLEVGVPAALLGAVVGALTGTVTWLLRRGRPTTRES